MNENDKNVLKTDVEKRDHYLKISYAPGKKSSDIPNLTISGRWFGALGYKVGDTVKISIDEENRLIIEKA